MPTVAIEEAQKTLPASIQRLSHDEEVVITENDQPVARLLAVTTVPRRQQRPRPLSPASPMRGGWKNCSLFPMTSRNRRTRRNEAAAGHGYTVVVSCQRGRLRRT